MKAQQYALKPLFKENTVDVDTLLDRILENPSLLTVIALTLGSLHLISASYSVYMLVFTGFLPPRASWSCMSERCTTIMQTFNVSESKHPTFYTIDTICKNKFVENVDYAWYNLSRSTYAVDFGKVCHSNDLALLNSVYFVGATVGLLLGSFIFERIGRRKSAMIGGFLNSTSAFLIFFTTNYYQLLCLRVLTGMGTFLASTGCFVWSLEFMTSRHRIYFIVWTGMLWTAGYFWLISVSFMIKSWNYIFLAASITTLLFCVPQFVLPDSPRFLLSIGKVTEAKMVLEAYSKLNGKPLDLSEVEVISSQNSGSNAKKISYRKQIGLFAHNRAMKIETFVLYWLWFCVCLMYYGCNYGWGTFGDSIYTTFLFVAAGEFISVLLKFLFLKMLGRRLSQISCFAGAFVCFSVGMIDSVWSEVWDLERLVTTIGVIFVSCGFSVAYLFTGELAPTSHRGFIISSCSVVARVAAFIGPFVSTMSENRRMKLGLNVFLAGSSALLAFSLPETEKTPIPEYPKDVTIRREKQNLKKITSLSVRTLQSPHNHNQIQREEM